ncbi:hypothetical protein E2320_007650, partial [Naja naja]
QSKTGGISLRDIEELITEIGYQCPWYPEKGSLDLGDWIKIGVHLHSEPRAPIQHLLLWQKCKEAVETGISFSASPGGIRTSSLCTIDSASANINAARDLLNPTKNLQAQVNFHTGHFRRHIECISPNTTRLERYDYVVWDSEYQRYAIQAGNNSGGGAYIPDQLYGARAFSNLQQQATGIPAAAYPAIGSCVLHAFKKVPVTGKPSKSFSTIKQENIPLTLVLIPTAKQPTAFLTQELTTAGKSSMNILEWIYLSHSPGHTISSPDTMYSELILKARERSLVLLGLDIVNIILPIPLKDWECMLHLSSSLQLALTEYVGKVSYHIPADQRILAFNRIPMSMYSVLSPTPLPEAIT